MDQAIELLLYLTPRDTCFFLCSSSDPQSLGEIYHQAIYLQAINPIFSWTSEQNWSKTLQWQQTIKAIKQATKLI